MKTKFLCPSCASYTLEIIISKDLGSDHRSDEVALQCVECMDCGFQGLSIYEESRRGASESVNHYGYQISETNYTGLRSDLFNDQVTNKNDYYHHKDKIFTMILKR